MLLVNFKNDNTSLWEQRLSLTGYFSQTCGLVKSTNCQYLVMEAKNEKSKGTLFSRTLKVGENKVVLLFSFLASKRRYGIFEFLTPLKVCLKSPVRKNLGP